MAHHTTDCTIVVCDRCHVPALNPDGSTQHWSCIEQALTELSGPAWSWAASTHEQTCSSCRTALRCQELGHDWGQWQSMRALGEGELAIRLCSSCGRDEVISVECLTASPRPLRSAS